MHKLIHAHGSFVARQPYTL